MTNIYAKAALLKQGWVKNVRLVIEKGKITAIKTGVASDGTDERYDYIIPGMDNVHSHAFQRAMSGLAERRGEGQDNFWSWRHLMYKQALQLDPDDMQAIAAQLYMEMLEAGFTRVGEFHYLHHDRDGRPYANLCEMAQSIASAAQTTGIGLTLLPVFYAHSGFGGGVPHDEQRRFINTIDGFVQLWQQCENLISSFGSHGQLGLAIHSLRAATYEEMQHLLPLAINKPVHIHIAEQVKEVEDCLEFFQARPVEWLLNNAPVDENWTLIHATHITPIEVMAVAKSGAVAGLCPITEANLGDGIFPMPDFLEFGGKFSIGSDSNIVISAVQELRQLEYSQRLNLHSRNVVAATGQSTGLRLFEEALRGGAKSIMGTGEVDVGKSADFVTLKVQDWADFSSNTLIDQWIFGQGIDVDCVFVAGKKRVEQGLHLDRAVIEPHFTATMRKLRS